MKIILKNKANDYQFIRDFVVHFPNSLSMLLTPPFAIL